MTALYMVTDYMDQSESLKQTLRTRGGALLSSLYSLKLMGALSTYNAFGSAEILSDEIVSFIEIASAVGLLSEMNAGILIREFQRLKEGLGALKEENKTTNFQDEKFATQFNTDIVLNEEYFHVPSDTQPSSKQDPSYFYKGHQLYKGQVNTNNVLNKVQHSDNEFSNKTSSKKSDIGLRLARRSAILSVIKDKKEVNIKDIVSLIKDCSEKTIQRELIALLSEGVLKKSGEKRWSRYSLI